MQKKLIALAIAGLSGAALAQSNVTIYGVADATFDIINVSGGSAALSGNTPNFTRVSTNGSRLGFKGTENLGNGLTALFQFESNANFDNSASTLGTSRDSFAGLSGNFGKVILGNLSTPTRAFSALLDVNAGNDGIGTNYALLGKLGGALANAGKGVPAFGADASRSATSASLFDTRFSNAIAYTTPSFSGLQATAAYMANENKTDTSGAKLNTSAYDLGLNYNNGPVLVGLTYAKVTEKNDVTGSAPYGSGALKTYLGSDQKLRELRLGGSYDFGVATLRALYAQTKADGSLNDVKQTVWGIGGTYNVTTNGKLTAQYYHAGDLDKSTGADDNTGAKFCTLGYEHSLSKRTLLKANYAYLKNDEKTSTNGFGGGYDFGKNSSGFAGDDIKLSGLQVGLRHSF
ncbi:MAG: porin [Rugosibacter sp.]|nr:MAG: porin [Rugosibacter sp.]